jgi:hypothetical protein
LCPGVPKIAQAPTTSGALEESFEGQGQAVAGCDSTDTLPVPGSLMGAVSDAHAQYSWLGASRWSSAPSLAVTGLSAAGVQATISSPRNAYGGPVSATVTDLSTGATLSQATYTLPSCPTGLGCKSYGFSAPGLIASIPQGLPLPGAYRACVSTEALGTWEAASACGKLTIAGLHSDVRRLHVSRAGFISGTVGIKSVGEGKAGLDKAQYGGPLSATVTELPGGKVVGHSSEVVTAHPHKLALRTGLSLRPGVSYRVCVATVAHRLFLKTTTCRVVRGPQPAALSIAQLLQGRVAADGSVTLVTPHGALVGHKATVTWVNPPPPTLGSFTFERLGRSTVSLRARTFVRAPTGWSGRRAAGAEVWVTVAGLRPAASGTPEPSSR